MPRPKGPQRSAEPPLVEPDTARWELVGEPATGDGKQPAVTPIVSAPISGKSREQVLREINLWEGWGELYSSIPLGPDNDLELPEKEDEPNPDVVGFAYPLAPVEFAFRNERRYPPMSEEDQYREMFKLMHHTIESEMFKRSYTLSIVYHHINSNRRESPGWQRSFIKVGGVQKLFEYFEDPEYINQDEEYLTDGTAEALGDRYWVMAILGRMMGTDSESRKYLTEVGAVDYVLLGTRDNDDQVRDCASSALKGLIQHADGMQVVTRDKLIKCLVG